MITIFDFLTNGMGRWIATFAGVGVLLLSWRVADTHQQRAIGEMKAMAKVERTNTDAIKKARAARAAAQQPKPNGLRDPHTLAD
jgi:hypothetical protein